MGDFSGKQHTEGIVQAPDNDNYTAFAKMDTWCTKFNETRNEAENYGYTDWYIPAIGQLIEINDNIEEIDALLSTIGGKPLISEYNYWSSSEAGSYLGWYINFQDDQVCHTNKSSFVLVRFVRNQTTGN